METLQSDSDRKGIECEELKDQVAKLEANKNKLEVRHEAVHLKRASLADQVAKLKEEVERLKDRVRVLTLENAGLSEWTTKLEVDLVAKNAVRGAL